MDGFVYRLSKSWIEEERKVVAGQSILMIDDDDVHSFSFV